MKLPVTEYILIGGGAKSPLWAQIICDLFQAPATVPKACDASFGAALLAGVGIGVFESPKQAILQSLKLDRTHQPNQGMASFYEEQFDRYRKIHDALAF